MITPDKIWSNGETNGALGDCWMECATEEMPGREISYTRTDLIPAQLAEARAEGRREGLREAALEAEDVAQGRLGDERDTANACMDRILALIDADAPSQPKSDAVREAAIKEAAEIAFEADDCYLARNGILALLDDETPKPKPDAVREIVARAIAEQDPHYEEFGLLGVHWRMADAALRALAGGDSHE